MQALFQRSLLDGGTIVSGPKSHKGVYLNLGYSAVQSQSPGYAVALPVPCEELYVPPGDLIIPLQAAAEVGGLQRSEPG